MIIRYNKQTKTLILVDKLPFFPKFKSVLCQTNNKILTSSRLQSATEKLSLTYYTLKQKQNKGFFQENL